MRIKSIHLNHFKGFDDLKVKFPRDSKFIVFISENGGGKTSLLEGISMILRHSLQKYHKYNKVDWDNPFNVNTSHQYGSISIGIQGAKRSYEFTQNFTADRVRLISEEKLALERNKDLTDEERIDHYESQASLAFKSKRFEKAAELYQKLSKIQEQVFQENDIKLLRTYFNVGITNSVIKSYDNSILYFNKAIAIVENNKTKKNIEEDKLTLRLFESAGDSYLEIGSFEIAINYFQKVLAVKKKVLLDEMALAKLYDKIAFAYTKLQNWTDACKYYKDAILILEKKDINTNSLAIPYHNIGIAYLKLDNLNDALNYFLKSLKVKEYNKASNSSLHMTYDRILFIYSKLGNTKESLFFKKKLQDLPKQNNKIPTDLPEKHDQAENDSYQHFMEYIETWTPLVLYYSAQQASFDNYKDAISMAFNIPMTTDFDMISDWFIEHENDENRKRLRVDVKYRSVELEIIRVVIAKGLSLINGTDAVRFSELQTEIEEAVQDGQVSSWLSIKKNDIRLNVNQLSDGEKRILVLFIDIARRLITTAKINNIKETLESDGIVLIDEIEQHLHPKWQRNLLPTLNKLFPNIQFVVTTHSPQVLSLVPNGSAFSLENGQANPLKTYGRDNQWILEIIMDDVSRPKEVREKLDNYFDLIKEDRLNEGQKLRKELESLIGEDEPELLKADILIRRKQKNHIKNETNS